MSKVHETDLKKMVDQLYGEDVMLIKDEFLGLDGLRRGWHVVGLKRPLYLGKNLKTAYKALSNIARIVFEDREAYAEHEHHKLMQYDMAQNYLDAIGVPAKDGPLRDALINRLRFFVAIAFTDDYPGLKADIQHKLQRM